MWKGDEVAACVAAASVVAKVTRDRLMRDLHTRYPVYGFARHKGYSTRSHMRALDAHGPCPEHRRSFANVGGVARDPADLEAPDSMDLEPTRLRRRWTWSHPTPGAGGARPHGPEALDLVLDAPGPGGARSRGPGGR